MMGAFTELHGSIKDRELSQTWSAGDRFSKKAGSQLRERS